MPTARYERRDPQATVLYGVVREDLATFLERAERRARDGGRALPAFVEKELRAFLRCGVLASGFALGPRRARFDGFDLHADVAVPARDRARLERLCRYTARPSVSNERLERRKDGTVVLHLKAPWSDGTEQILFEPLELLERLALRRQAGATRLHHSAPRHPRHPPLARPTRHRPRDGSGEGATGRGADLRHRGVSSRPSPA